MPALDIGNLSYLRVIGVEKYLKKLQRRYPNWKRFESLSESEGDSHSIPRNLREWYWELIKDGKVNFPVLPGQWMAVETVEKPFYGSRYPRTPLAEKLGFGDDRFNVSWNDAHNTIGREKRRILSEIGLHASDAADLRLLDALEWNLLGNREGWGESNTYEWTNTVYREFCRSRRLAAGFSFGGGAAYVYWNRPDGSYVHVGFRAALVLGS